MLVQILQKPLVVIIATLIVNGLVSPFSRAAACAVKPAITEIGKFSSDPLDEASGLALASDGRHFFVTNDSGDKSRFFRTKLDGTITHEFRVIGLSKPSEKFFDVEALSVGPCPRTLQGDCVVIADIGDNRDRRKSVELSFFRVDVLKLDDPSAGAKRVKIDVGVDKKIKLKYPDGPRNAEAFAVLNSKYGLIVSKEQDRKARATKPAGVYVVNFETAEVAKVASWDVPSWMRDKGLSALVTDISVDVSKPGVIRIVILTYQDAFEFEVATDIHSSTAKIVWPPKLWPTPTPRRIPLEALQQQETITFDSSKQGFYVSSEVPMSFLGLGSAPIRHVEKTECL